MFLVFLAHTLPCSLYSLLVHFCSTQNSHLNLFTSTIKLDRVCMRCESENRWTGGVGQARQGLEGQNMEPKSFTGDGGTLKKGVKKNCGILKEDTKRQHEAACLSATHLCCHLKWADHALLQSAEAQLTPWTGVQPESQERCLLCSSNVPSSCLA